MGLAMLASLAGAADTVAPTTPGTLAAGSAGGYLLMGIFIHLVIVLPLMLMLARPDASIFTRVLLCVAACAAMTALYWFAGVGAPRAWLAAQR